jgi:hypothetical protein
MVLQAIDHEPAQKAGAACHNDTFIGKLSALTVHDGL